MKKFLILLFLAVTFTTCTVNKKDKTAGDESVLEVGGLVSYKFKVDGLHDLAVYDSVWKIIFQIEGVDKLIISKDDSSAVFTVDPSLVSHELLRQEIIKRGGEVLY